MTKGEGRSSTPRSSEIQLQPPQTGQVVHADPMSHHADRPTKICACCGRPFQWRRKWKDVWEEVRYCSDRCRNQARRPASRRQAQADQEGQA